MKINKKLIFDTIGLTLLFITLALICMGDYSKSTGDINHESIAAG